MAVEGEPKNPEVILTRSDPKKVDLLLNQYLNQGDADLKTRLTICFKIHFS